MAFITSKGVIFSFDSQALAYPTLICADCGERLVFQPQYDDNKNIYLKVYECKTNSHLRWELKEQILKLRKKKCEY